MINLFLFIVILFQENGTFVFTKLNVRLSFKGVQKIIGLNTKFNNLIYDLLFVKTLMSQIVKKPNYSQLKKKKKELNFIKGI